MVLFNVNLREISQDFQPWKGIYMADRIKHITQERLKELFELTDKGLVWKTSRIGASTIGKGSYIHKSTGYKLLKVDYRQYREHRLVWLYVHGTLPKMLDHIDGDKTNNDINNLRKSTQSQNMHNMTLSSHNTSGVKGVSWNKRAQKWRARIKLKGKEIHIGNFVTLEQAEVSIHKARKKLHKQFANHGVLNV